MQPVSHLNTALYKLLLYVCLSVEIGTTSRFFISLPIVRTLYMKAKNYIFCTPDQDFRCFYPCEILSIYLYHPEGKIKNEQPRVGFTSILDVIKMLK